MDISRNLIDSLLANQGMNQSMLAEKIGCNRSWLSTVINRGSCLPTTAGRIARGLGVDVSAIVKQEKE